MTHFELEKKLDADRDRRISELEGQLKEAWAEASDSGEVFGIYADHLPALICGCRDKALQRISELEAEVVRLRESNIDLIAREAQAQYEKVSLRDDRERLKASIIRRSGASSWDEWSGIWDPTEETAIDAVTRLAKERDAAVQRADKQEDLTRKALQSAYQAQQEWSSCIKERDARAILAEETKP